MPKKDQEELIQEAFERGARDRRKGNNVNPYDGDDGPEASAWEQGWLQDERDQHG